ncbi:MAG TPA: hypothetical protein VEQ59_11530, partial [Polyangiaceae bacterium]|nr:hypothetical protein [Polyangiaceae bacterium]
FDGSQWHQLVLPSEQELRLKLGDAASPDPLWLEPNNFVVRGDRVYLAANIKSGNDRDFGMAIIEPAPSELPQAVAVVAGGESAGCTPLVVLFAVSKTTAADYQYPATKDAVLGTPFATSAQFLEVNRGGHRTLVAQTASRKDAEALAALVRQRITGSRPSVVCEPLPEVLRKITIE